MERLAWMAPQEARAIYDSLCRAWEAIASREEGLGQLEGLRVEALVQRRRAFERLAARKGSL